MRSEARPERAGLPADITILVGEDDPEVRHYLEIALKCQGYSVSLAEDGEEVLERLRANDPPVRPGGSLRFRPAFAPLRAYHAPAPRDEARDERPPSVPRCAPFLSLSPFPRDVGLPRPVVRNHIRMTRRALRQTPPAFVVTLCAWRVSA